jgi:hypothetical protein
MLLRVRHAAYSACWIWPRSQFAAEMGPFLFTRGSLSTVKYDVNSKVKEIVDNRIYCVISCF